MKKILLSFTLILFTFLSVTAQNQVTMIIDHQLDGEEFLFNTTAQNNLDHKFNYNRLEYYISGFSLIHDGGQETVVDDLYVLVTTGLKGKTEIDLGMHTIDNIEKLVFHLGVDEPHNHLDPTIYEADHPLAPKDPSMHWGWAGGYRFIALEGLSSPALNQDLQMHCIGDENYVKIEIDLEEEAIDGTITLDIIGNYAQAVRDIDINSGLIQHGNLGPIVTLVENFKTHVFSDANTPVNILETSIVHEFSIYPNPVLQGQLTVNIESSEKDFKLEVYNTTGQLINQKNATNGTNTIDVSTPGLFSIIARSASGKIVASTSFVVE